jgi:hypothetical protein
VFGTLPLKKCVTVVGLFYILNINILGFKHGQVMNIAKRTFPIQSIKEQ